MALQTHYAVVYSGQDWGVQIKPFQVHHIEYVEGFGFIDENLPIDEYYAPDSYSYMTAQAILSKMNAWAVSGQYYRLCTETELREAQNG